MEKSVYAAESATEATHWWFTGRRRLFASIITELHLSPEDSILDVGTSTGTNLRMLHGLGFHNFLGIDNSRDAIQFCKEKGLGDVRHGSIDALPFPSDCFDLVLATDILEHVNDDVGALRELQRVLKPTGHLLLTVPTFQFMWGLQDEVSHHHRRYRMPEILDKMDTVGLEPREYFYFNYILMFPIFLTRKFMRLFNVDVPSENRINTRIINHILSLVFHFDTWSSRRIRPLCGVSALVLASRSIRQ